MGKPRNTRKYPTYPEIPESKKDTRKYPIVFFDTPTRPEPDPLPGILSTTRPDPTRYWKTLPTGHWSQYEQIQIFLHKQNPNGHLYWRCIFDCSLEFLCWISGFRSRVLVLNIWWLPTWAIKVAIWRTFEPFSLPNFNQYHITKRFNIKKMKNKLDFRNFLTYPLNHES